MKNIIVPIDFSEESIKGLQAALLFANKQHTNIQMVYVLKRSGDFKTLSAEEEKNYAERKLEQMVKNYGENLDHDSRLRFIIKKGKIYEEIVDQAESYKDALIIMSTHGASGFEDLFIGSNAFKIISATELPVITVNKGECPKDVNRIILPIDASPKTRQKVSYTADLARIMGADIHVVAVTSSQSKKIVHRITAYTNQVCGYLQSLKLDVTRAFRNGDNVTDVTIDYANEVSADLISIMTDQTAHLNFLVGSYAHQMINKSNTLVLSITPKNIGKAGSFSTYGG